MVYVQKYESPVGDILLAADGIGLTGLWFDGERFFADNLPAEHIDMSRFFVPKKGTAL